MTIIKDRTGRVYNGLEYLSLLAPTRAVELVIRSQLSAAERSLIEEPDRLTILSDYNRSVRSCAEHLLLVAAYSRNLLAPSYTSSPGAMEKLEYYVHWLKRRKLPHREFEYYLPKAISVGVNIQITPRQIEKLIEYFKQSKDYSKVKMLSRAAIFGITYPADDATKESLTLFTNRYTQQRINLQQRLESIDAEKNKERREWQIAHVVDKYDVALLAAATRAGFDIELSKEMLEFYISTDISFDTPGVNTKLWEMSASRWRDIPYREVREYQDKLEQRIREDRHLYDKGIFMRSLSTAHHLKDILGR